MSARTSSERRDLKRIIVITLAALTLVVAGAVGLMGYAAVGIDRLQAEKERELAQVRLDRTLEGLIENINSSAIWNDSVITLAGEPDLEWLQTNFGDYYADFMGHAVTLIYDRHGELILTSRESDPVDPASERAFIKAVTPLVAEVSREAAGKRDRPRVSFDAAVNRGALVRAGADIYLVGFGTVVPEDMTQPRLQNDPVIVSAKPISELLGALEKDLAIRNPVIAETGVSGSKQGYLVLSGPDGEVLGHVRWTPDRPGLSVLQGAAPAVAGLILLLAAAALALFVRVHGIVRRLEENEVDLTEARDRAEGANVAKSRFLANVSHELRTPLNGVVGMAEVMAMDELSPIQRSRLDVLRESSNNLLRLIERLLQVTRLERREVLVDRIVFDPTAMTGTMVDQYRAAARAKGLELTLHGAETGSRLGDELHVQQVLDFLIDNAITYTDDGQVSVSVGPRDAAVRFTVTDTGMGIAPELLPRLFDVFVQADDSITRRFEGAGVGLSICRNLVEAMGGRISVDSEPGRGSTFTVDLPLPPAVQSAVHEPLAA
jgi:signal transduction histidine kinase